MADDYTYLLENWAALNASLMDLSEEQVETLLNEERSGQKRPAFLLRLYGRFNTLRTQRERRELLAE